jgi:bifunctional non-homologous end joining protein LigD
LSHVRRRAQTIKRHYTVPRGPFVWEKDAPAELPEWFDIVELPARSRRGDPVRYAVANDELALLWLVEYGCVDLHVGTARVDLPERPDFVLFDLDAAGVAFSSVVEAALLLREALDALGLVALPMTTGVRECTSASRSPAGICTRTRVSSLPRSPWPSAARARTSSPSSGDLLRGTACTSIRR